MTLPSINHLNECKVFYLRCFPTGTPRRIHVDSTSIRRRPNFDEFLRHFHVLFRCNFADRKIHLVSTYFFRRNFAGRKIHVVSTYFFRRTGRKSTLFPRTFFDVISMAEKSRLFPRTCFDVIFPVEISTLFLLTFYRGNFDGKKLTSLW